MRKITGYIVIIPESQSVRKRLNSYSVLLSCRLIYYYSNRKEAEAFQNRLFSWVNDIQIQLNEAYISSFADYRRLWLFYDTDIQDSRKIESLFKGIEKSFELLYYRIPTPATGTLNVVNHLIRITGSLLEVYAIMTEKQKLRNNWEALKTYDFRKNFLRKIEFELKNPDKVIDPGNKLDL